MKYIKTFEERNNFEFCKISINDNEFQVKILRDSHEIGKGMMKSKFDENYNGLLFIVPKGIYSLWTKDCLEHIDIIFLEKNKIVKIYHNCPPLEDDEKKLYTNSCDCILEIKGGSCKKLNINENDLLKYL